MRKQKHSNQDALTVGGVWVQGKGKVKEAEKFIQLKGILCSECIINYNEPVTN